MPSACDVLPNDQTSQKIKSKKSKQNKLKNGPINGHENGMAECRMEEISSGEETSMIDEPTPANKAKTEQELVFIHDAAFTIKISCPGIETFDLQVIVWMCVSIAHFLHCLSGRDRTN